MPTLSMRPLVLALAWVTVTATLAAAAPTLRLPGFRSGAGTCAGTGVRARVTMGQPIVGHTGGLQVRCAAGFWPSVGGNTPTAAPAAPAATLALSNRLLPGAPNPFNPATTIRFTLAREEEVRLDLFDLRGRHVRELAAARLSAGEHIVVLHADALASGTYVVRLRAGAFTASRTLTLAK